MKAEQRELIMPAAETPTNALTPMGMLDRAVASGASIETLDKLMNLQERWEKNQARKAFDAAVAAAKAELTPVTRNQTGYNNKKYADFAAIASAVDPIITRHGLSYRFRSAQTDKTISVTCILSHKDGHFEETTLSGPADTTGNKNAIQAIGSTCSYLQRYSLVQMLGLASAADDDGKAGGGGFITEPQAETIKALINDIGGENASGLFKGFCKKFKIEKLPDLPLKEYDNAIAALESKRRIP